MTSCTSVETLEKEVDGCIKQNFQTFFEQAKNNVRQKHPNLTEDQVRILAVKLLVVVKENFKLNEAYKIQQIEEIGAELEKCELELSGNENIIKNDEVKDNKNIPQVADKQEDNEKVSFKRNCSLRISQKALRKRFKNNTATVTSSREPNNTKQNVSKTWRRIFTKKRNKTKSQVEN